jgi:hypothetical protein
VTTRHRAGFERMIDALDTSRQLLCSPIQPK